MNPEDVPADLVEIYGRNYSGNSNQEAKRRGLAAVLTAHGRQVRERVAADIEAERSGGTEHWVTAMDHAARIARGES